MNRLTEETIKQATVGKMMTCQEVSSYSPQEIREAINRYERRVSVTQIECEPDFDNNGYNVEVEYTIIGRDDIPVAVEFILERTR